MLAPIPLLAAHAAIATGMPVATCVHAGWIRDRDLERGSRTYARTGWILAFKRKRFVGSYFVLAATSRS